MIHHWGRSRISWRGEGGGEGSLKKQSHRDFQTNKQASQRKLPKGAILPDKPFIIRGL